MTTIRIERHGAKVSMTVDGVEFPWLIGLPGPSVTADPDSQPAVTVTILCDRVELVDEL